MPFTHYSPLFTKNGEKFFAKDEEFYVEYTEGDFIEIECYDNKADDIQVNKLPFLTKIGTIVGIFRDSVNLIHPTLTFELSSPPTFNYVKIPILNRWYYVDSVEYVTKNLYEMNLSIDILMSYRNDINEQNALIERNEYAFNPLIQDSFLMVESGIDIEEIDGDITVSEYTGGDSTHFALVGAVGTLDPT